MKNQQQKMSQVIEYERRSGAEEIRTPDPHVANVVLYQLSYRPLPQKCGMWNAKRGIVTVYYCRTGAMAAAAASLACNFIFFFSFFSLIESLGLLSRPVLPLSIPFAMFFPFQFSPQAPVDGGRRRH